MRVRSFFLSYYHYNQIQSQLLQIPFEFLIKDTTLYYIFQLHSVFVRFYYCWSYYSIFNNNNNNVYWRHQFIGQFYRNCFNQYNLTSKVQTNVNNITIICIMVFNDFFLNI